jgi:hypothetical protein
MRIVEGIGIAVLALLMLLAAVFLRRGVLARHGGTIELSVRLSTMVFGRGWSTGLARFSGEELRWYRMFSLSWRPKRVLSRRGLTVVQRRLPNTQEKLVFPADFVVIRCVCGGMEIEVAMARPALMGFLSWVEAAPPGGLSGSSRQRAA